MKQKPTSSTTWRTAAATMTFAAALGLAPANAQPIPADLDGDGIENRFDPDVDNDGIPNGADRNVDGGKCRKGFFKGKYIGDRLKNDDPKERDIDGDGLADDSNSELDIDGDRRKDDAPGENDIDGDGRLDDHPSESDIDGDGRDDSSDADIDGDGRNNGDDDDCDGDGRRRGRDNDDDGDGSRDSNDSDDDNNGISDDDEDDNGDGDNDGGTPLTASLQKAPGLSNEAEGSVEVQYGLNGVTGAEIEVEEIPAGSYDLIIANTNRGTLVVSEVRGKLRGKLRFETVPNDSDENLLNFPIAGESIVISQNGNTFFSGTAPSAT